MRRLSGYTLTVGLPLLLAFAATLISPEPVPRLQDVVFDGYQRMAAHTRDPQQLVRIVAIDEESLARIGQWPWPRDRFATLAQKLSEAGAAAIVFDIVYGEPDRSSPDLLVQQLPQSHERDVLQQSFADGKTNHDAIFAAALGQAPAVLGFIGSDSGPPIEAKAGFASAGDPAENFVPHFAGAITPIRALSEAARGLGAVNWIPDGDSVIRKVPTVISAGGKLAPSLSIEALRVAQGADSVLVRSSNASGQTAFGTQSGINAVRIGNLVVETEGTGEMRLLARRADPSSWISASRIISGDFSPDDIAGRIVYVGAVAIGLEDRRTTPVEASVPGVEIHAQITEQILSGTRLIRPDWMQGFEASLLLLLGALLAVVLRRARNRPWISSAAGLAVPAAIGGFSWAMFSWQGILVDPVMPVVGVFAVLLAATVYHFQEAEHRRAEVRSVFGRFVTPAVVERLVEAPDRIVLGGELRPISIMFSDVRSFTSLAEDRTPQDVVSLIRRIHTPATDAVLRHGGTLDKFIGDGMMAFWNAPLDMPDHAVQACRAALAIIDTSHRFADPPIRMGVGIHTGEACVGNLGSEQRLEYSALGDAVNIAARIEPLTKLYGVEIVVSADTATAAGELAFLELESVRVKGRQAAITLYALHAVAEDDALSALKAVHSPFLEAYRCGDLRTAERLLAENEALYGETYASLVAYYRERLMLLRESAEGWDGVHTLEHK